MDVNGIEIKVKIDAPDLVNALLSLSASINAQVEMGMGLGQLAVKQMSDTASKENPKAQERSAAQTSNKSRKSSQGKESAAPDNTKSDPTPTKKDEAPSVAELRAVAQEKGQSVGKEAIKQLLDDFGSKSISSVPEDKRSAFLSELQKL